MQASPRSLRKLGCARSEEPGGVYLMRTSHPNRSATPTTLPQAGRGIADE